MIKVFVNGFKGRMGSGIVEAVSADSDFVVVGGYDPKAAEGTPVLVSVGVTPAPAVAAPVFRDLAEGLEATKPDVMVDFTHPSAVAENIEIALRHNIHCVVGTTGLAPDDLTALYERVPTSANLFYAPNFTMGAVLMMACAQKVARYFADAEIIEFHHNGKADAPSGTAINTALAIASVREQAGIRTTAPGKETELPGKEGARGTSVQGVLVHSVRSDGFVAHQEVIFGSAGETLTIRHDSISRSAYMPGILLAIRSVPTRRGLIIGLDKLLDL
ncbi:MAG: 4-hydroxy-tetrahydrodipicolinate reductase [Coriobacteriales bacterium]|jgi:4-hydroxy-tetrahydrodipicolinate reductase|nr:4-hydroxy-tetrahydrodipicolinate reductase [Coriobacteriales bacterium]